MSKHIPCGTILDQEIRNIKLGIERNDKELVKVSVRRFYRDALHYQGLSSTEADWHLRRALGRPIADLLPFKQERYRKKQPLRMGREQLGNSKIIGALK